MKDEFSKEMKAILSRILSAMGEDMRDELMDADKRCLQLYHFGLGTWIRNFILTEGSEILRLFEKMGFWHKDDMSAMIIIELHKYIQG